MVDFEIPFLLSAYVDFRAIYGIDSEFGLKRCDIIAFTSYKGRAPTFKVLLEDGSLFSFVPINFLYHKNVAKEDTFTLDVLAYKNCPDYTVAINSLRHLQGSIKAYLHKIDAWMAGEYIFSVDWYLDNLIMHCVKLENGQFAMLPSHKVKFKNNEENFDARYRKMSVAWSVAE